MTLKQNQIVVPEEAKVHVEGQELKGEACEGKYRRVGFTETRVLMERCYPRALAFSCLVGGTPSPNTGSEH